MRIDHLDKFWIVTDPKDASELGDILFKTDLEGLRLQFLGGLAVTEARLTIHTDQGQAIKDAENRMQRLLDERGAVAWAMPMSAQYAELVCPDCRKEQIDAVNSPDADDVDREALELLEPLEPESPMLVQACVNCYRVYDHGAWVTPTPAERNEEGEARAAAAAQEPTPEVPEFHYDTDRMFPREFNLDRVADRIATGMTFLSSAELAQLIRHPIAIDRLARAVLMLRGEDELGNRVGKDQAYFIHGPEVGAEVPDDMDEQVPS